LFNADRLTLYAVNDRTAIIAKVKTGLNTSKDRLNQSVQSIAGYVAMSHQLLNIADTTPCSFEDPPQLSFLTSDRRSGYRTKQMLVAPVMALCFTACSRSSTTTSTSRSVRWKKTAPASFVRPWASRFASACSVEELQRRKPLRRLVLQGVRRRRSLTTASRARDADQWSTC
jgi:hypothetical protein